MARLLRASCLLSLLLAGFVPPSRGQEKSKVSEPRLPGVISTSLPGLPSRGAAPGARGARRPGLCVPPLCLGNLTDDHPLSSLLCSINPDLGSKGDKMIGEETRSSHCSPRVTCYIHATLAPTAPLQEGVCVGGGRAQKKAQSLGLSVVSAGLLRLTEKRKEIHLTVKESEPKRGKRCSESDQASLLFTVAHPWPW
jgi:hypothetical protein